MQNFKKVVARGAGNTDNFVARGHLSLGHIKLDDNRELKQAMFLSTRTSAGSKSRRYKCMANDGVSRSRLKSTTAVIQLSRS